MKTAVHTYTHKSISDRLLDIAFCCGGSTRTRQDRQSTVSHFAVNTLGPTGSNIKDIAQLGGRHLEKYARLMLEQGLAPGTIANRWSHLTRVYDAIGKGQILKNKPLYGKQALGFVPRSRKGTGRPLERLELTYATTVALALHQEGIGITLELQFFLGLRVNEAVSADAEQLERWSKELKSGNVIEITRGTKNGKDRVAHIVDPALALSVVERAYKIASQQDGGFLVVSRHGERLSLKSARAKVMQFWGRLGIRSHWARYAYAMSLANHFMNIKGMSKAMAFRQVAKSLGHGDSRATYVWDVYCNMSSIDSNRVVRSAVLYVTSDGRHFHNEPDIVGTCYKKIQFAAVIRQNRHYKKSLQLLDDTSDMKWVSEAEMDRILEVVKEVPFGCPTGRTVGTPSPCGLLQHSGDPVKALSSNSLS